jgi:hypothetical protein
MTIINNALNILKITETLSVGEKYYFYEKVSENLIANKNKKNSEYLSNIKAMLRNDHSLSISALNIIDHNIVDPALVDPSPMQAFAKVISRHTV